MASLPQRDLTAISWTFTAIAGVMTAGRYLVRSTIIGRFHWDDATHLLAFLFLVAHTSLYTGAASLVYQVKRYRAGKEVEKPDYLLYLRLEVTESMLLWLGFLSVKITFLLFYRLLFRVSNGFIKAWWVVLALCLMSFWVCVAGVLTECGRGSDLFNIEKCLSESAIQSQKVILQYSCAVNVLSDIAIMALPLSMLRGLQIRPVLKFGLATIFCCGLIIISFDVLRTVESVYGGGAVALSSLWTNLESAIAVIVSCIPTYSAIFTSNKGAKASRIVAFASKNPFAKSTTVKNSGNSNNLRVAQGDEMIAARSSNSSDPSQPSYEAMSSLEMDVLLKHQQSHVKLISENRSLEEC